MKRNNSKLVVVALLVLLGLMVGRQTLQVSEYLVSDALFIVGIMSLLLGMLVVVRNSRLFDLVGFSFKRFMEVILNRPQGDARNADSYAAYCLQPRPRRDPRMLIGLGSICMLFSVFSALL